MLIRTRAVGCDRLPSPDGLPGLLIALLLAPAAWAHYPHLPVLSATSENGIPWALVATDSDVQPRILVSLDARGFWQPDNLPADFQDPLALVATAVALNLVDVAADGTSVLWTRPDGGDWSPLALPTVGAPLSAASDDVAVYVAGTLGLARVARDGSVTALASTPTDLVAATADLLAWTDGTELYTASGPTSNTDSVALAHAPALSLATDGASVWAGHAPGVDRWDGSAWTACGVLPVPDPTADYTTSVVLLATNAGDLYAGTGQDLYRSSDGCATWTRIPTDGGQAYGEEGEPTSAASRWTALTVDPSPRAYGWPGVWRLDDDVGAHEAIGGVGTVHAVAPFDGGLLLMPYGQEGIERVGAAITRLDPAPNHQQNYFPRSVASDDAGGAIATFDDGLLGWTGQGWDAVASPLFWPSSVIRTPTRWWVAGRYAGADPGAWSTDGVTFHVSSTFEAAVSPASRATLRFVPSSPGGGAIYALLQPNGLVRSEDDGDTWTRASEAVVLDVVGLPDRLLLATPAGVEASADGGATSTVVLDDPGVNTLAVTSDGVAWAGDHGGRLWRSVDGVTWTQAGTVSGGVFALGADGVGVFAAGFEGAEVGDALEAVEVPQRFGFPSNLVDCVDADGVVCPNALDDNGIGWTISVGTTLRFRGRGAFLSVDDGAFDAVVDGVEMGRVTAHNPLALGVDEWHDVRLNATKKAILYGVDLSSTAPPDAGCGCASAPRPTALWPLVGPIAGLVVALLRRRNSRV